MRSSQRFSCAEECREGEVDAQPSSRRPPTWHRSSTCAARRDRRQHESSTSPRRVLRPAEGASEGARTHLEERLAVLVHLDLGDDDVGGVDGDGDGGAVALVARDALDEDTEVLAVRGVDAALTALVGAADDLHGAGPRARRQRARSRRGRAGRGGTHLDLVILADGKRANLRARVEERGSARPFVPHHPRGASSLRPRPPPPRPRARAFDSRRAPREAPSRGAPT